MSPSISTVPTVLRWVKQVWDWFARRVRADHRAIQAQQVWSPINATATELHVTVCLAPSRSLRRVIPEDELVERAAALKESLYPGVLPDQTATFDGTFVNFDVMYDDPRWATYVRYRLTLRNTGYVELFWPAGGPPTDSQAPYLADALELLQPVWRLLQAVDHGSYRRLVLGPQSRRLGSRRRVDSRVFITSGCVMAEGPTVQWTGLTFPGVEPEGRATNGRGAVEATGLAPGHLWSMKQHGHAATAVSDVARDLLRQCQYHGTVDAVSDLVTRLQGITPMAPAIQPARTTGATRE